MSENENKDSKKKRKFFLYLSTFISVGFSVVAMFFWINQTGRAQEETVSIEQIETVGRGDLLIYAKPPSRILYVSDINGSVIYVVFYPGTPTELKERRSLASQIKRVVKKNDPDYAATAARFLQQ